MNTSSQHLQLLKQTTLIVILMTMSPVNICDGIFHSTIFQGKLSVDREFISVEPSSIYLATSFWSQAINRPPEEHTK